MYENDVSIRDIYEQVGRKIEPNSGGKVGGPAASTALQKAGIKGITYKDGFSRNKDGGTYNYVIFDDRLISISKKYGIGIPAAAALLAEQGEDTDGSYEQM